MFSSVSMLNLQFQNTQPCRPPYASDQPLLWEEDSVCCVTLEGHEPSLCLSVFDVMRRLLCSLVGDGEVREWDTNWVQHRREQGPETSLSDARPPSTFPMLSFQAHRQDVSSPWVGGRLCTYKVILWSSHLPPGLVSPPTVALGLGHNP